MKAFNKKRKPKHWKNTKWITYTIHSKKENKDYICHSMLSYYKNSKNKRYRLYDDRGKILHGGIKEI